MGCVLYELYVLRSPFAGPGMNYYMLGHKLLANSACTCSPFFLRLLEVCVC